ncbi:tyrosine-type recombinase/integrase [Spirillospora albida]|uniref:tyrosine-type recombinase/integrase n=1 Tax=Spirillospora albida TaxID=58123 RepID=UPI0004C09F8D|nr:tyrosine-type recombinase/integrase [Spirillospora albida]
MTTEPTTEPPRPAPDQPLEPTAISRGRAAAPTPHAGGAAVTGPPGAGERPPPPAPLATSVGDIPGLSPRRRRGEGEVAAAVVDLVDRLPRPQPWNTVAAWLRSFDSLETRRTYLASLAAFLRWLELAAPQYELFTVTEDVLIAYKDQIGTATGTAAELLPGGRPLRPSTVARRIAALRSLYGYAVRRHALPHNPASFVDPPRTPGSGTTPAQSKDTAAALMRGAEHIADRHPADAAAVGLLLNIGARAAEVISMPVGAFTKDGDHQVARFRIKGGAEIPVPITPRVHALIEPLLRGRSRHEYLLLREDGRPFDRWRLRTALRRAARAGGIDPDTLTNHSLRATAITLLLAAGVPLWDVQALVGHADPRTTQRYNRTGARLDGHASYAMGGLLGDES